MNAEQILELFDGADCVLVVADQNYVIRYVNELGIAHFAGFGGRDIVGTSLMDCHSDVSNEKIRILYDEFRARTRSLMEKTIDIDGRRRRIVYLPQYNHAELVGVMEMQYWLD